MGRVSSTEEDCERPHDYTDQLSTTWERRRRRKDSIGDFMGENDVQGGGIHNASTSLN